MSNVFLIGCGASLGAVLRYLLTTLYKSWRSYRNFPFATLLINLTGSFVLGWLLKIGLSTNWAAFLTTGLLGGYTTFSTFNTELVGMIDEKRWRNMIEYLLLSAIGGPAFAMLGLMI